MPDIPHIPNIFIELGLGGNNFAAVDDRTASDSEDKINVVFPDELCAFLHFGIGRIGHDSIEIRHVLACFFQPPTQFIVKSRAFQRAAAIRQ